jgi:hypothetical protein
MTTRLSNPTETLSGSLSARRLTPEVAEVLAQCLVEGRSRQSIADRLGVSVRTVSRWKASPLVERWRNRSDEVRAADVLLRLMECDDERVALRAAELVLTHKIQRTPKEPEPPGDQAPSPTSAIVIKFEGTPEQLAEMADKIEIVDGEIVAEAAGAGITTGVR